MFGHRPGNGHALRQRQPRRILLHGGGSQGFNPHAKAAIEWTQEKLTEDDRQWLRDLKYFRLVANFSIVHSTLDEPERWGYVFNKLEAASSFTYQNTKVCFFGHTHVPVAFVKDATIGEAPIPNSRLSLERNTL